MRRRDMVSGLGSVEWACERRYLTPDGSEATIQLIRRLSTGGRKLSSKISAAVGRAWNR
ncbi:hypothetical protein BRAS3843_2780017 [Bradyrhizobium sp. STM 3843]|nr:hypothetical protein BRAS3843_2780017 [Bradyrhizobium sp. STM 3843]